MNKINLQELLGDKLEYLLQHQCKTILKEQLTIPSSTFVDDVFMLSDRNNRVLGSLQTLFSQGRLGNTGYLSILPVDQGIEHSAGSAFAPNPMYFDPENIVRLAIESGCNGVTSSYGVLSSLARKYAHKIPFIVKFNHNELLTYPEKHRQIPFAQIEDAYNMGAIGIGATIYFGSPHSSEEIEYVAEAFSQARHLGMVTILWCYLRNTHFVTKDGHDYHTSADLTGQAIHLGASLGADIVKQKLPTNNYGFKHIGFGKTHPNMYDKLCSDHPIDLCRYQVINGYNGKIGLINSGGSSGDNDLAEAIETAIINKRAGGMGLILGRKAFQKPMQEGIALLQAIQDIYLDSSITIA